VFAVGVTDREDHADPVSQEPAGHEREDLGRLVIDPLRVVDDAQERLFRARRRQHGQRRQADEQAVDRRSFFEAESDAQRSSLAERKFFELRRERMQELMESHEAELHLGFDPGEPLHAQIDGRRNDVVEERGLPDPGFAANHDRAAQAIAHCVDQLPDLRPLRRAPQKSWGRTLAHAADVRARRFVRSPQQVDDGVPAWSGPDVRSDRDDDG
jgi:hypothetical protein